VAAVKEHKPAETWDEFRALLSEGSPIVDGVTKELWRGQGDSSWPLASVVERTIIEHRCPNIPIYPYGGALGAPSDRFWTELDKFRLNYIEMFDQAVIALGHALPQPGAERHSYVSALGRHHGLATRLLDWTKKPFIASFFAATDLLDRVSAGKATKDATATVFRLICVERLQSEGLAVLLNFQTPGVLRLHAQHGAFTELRTPGYLEVEGFVRDKIQSSFPILTKYPLTVGAARQGLIDLANHGISHQSLFPDFDGAAEEINRYLGPTLKAF
jgi:hypothetical protein